MIYKKENFESKGQLKKYNAVEPLEVAKEPSSLGGKAELFNLALIILWNQCIMIFLGLLRRAIIFFRG